MSATSFDEATAGMTLVEKEQVRTGIIAGLRALVDVLPVAECIEAAAEVAALDFVRAERRSR